MTSSCSRWIQPHRAATNHCNGDTAGFYVSHVRSSFGTVRDWLTERAKCHRIVGMLPRRLRRVLA